MAHELYYAGVEGCVHKPQANHITIIITTDYFDFQTQSLGLNVHTVIVLAPVSYKWRGSMGLNVFCLSLFNRSWPFWSCV